MDHPGGNGGDNGDGRYCHTFGDSVKYPVQFDLKAIIDAGIAEEESIASLEVVLKKNKVPFENWRQKSSSGGKYISYTVSVEIKSQKQLEKVYKELKTIPGLKFAL
jgi:putative lipoic acid-binding regulatory protein